MKNNKLNFMKDLYDEAQMILEENSNESVLRIPATQQNTFKNKKKASIASSAK
jgi:hypothetical protein